jgi:hypothetical protein
MVHKMTQVEKKKSDLVAVHIRSPVAAYGRYLEKGEILPFTIIGVHS